MYSFQEQFSAATKSQLEGQITMFTTLAGKTFEGIEKIIDLNLNVVKASLEESTANIQQLLAAKDPQEFFSLSTAQIVQPNAEKALAYGRHFFSITSNLVDDYTKAAGAQTTETTRQFTSLVEEVSKNTPGAENAVTFMKSAIAKTNEGYEHITRTSKRAFEAFEGAADQLTQVTQAATKASSRAAAGAKK